MNSIISEYDKKIRTFTSFSNSLKSLIESFLLHSDIEVHTIACRIKDRNSLEKKIIAKGTYSCLSDITDVVGVRIITHYSDDVDKIAKIIEKEFSVDKLNSIDKRATLEPDRFGYLSLHYIVGLKKERLNLVEYANFKEIKAEIQIRSILQHTWAEIEHDTGYKSNTGIPNEIRRRFSRLAGLLEIADNEFIEIKRSIDKHRTKIEKEIKKGSNNIPIDQISLIEFVNNDDSVELVATKIHEVTGYRLTKAANSTGMTIILVTLAHHNITNLKQLKEIIVENTDGIVKRFAWVAKSLSDEDKTILRHFILSYLTQVLAIKDGDPKKIEGYIKTLDDNKISHTEDLFDTLYGAYIEYFAEK